MWMLVLKNCRKTWTGHAVKASIAVRFNREGLVNIRTK
ncbi:hypothetical protein Gotur_024597 [Gossypium turneri]